MSFQPQVQMTGVQPPPVIAPVKGKRRKGLLVLGLVLILGGVLGGGAVVVKGKSNYEDAVKALARAPVGCTTTLVFDKPATFTVYVETKGKLDKLSGDCEANGSDYSHPGDKLPRVSMTLVDGNDDEVTLERGVTASYDVGGYVGTAVRKVTIEEAGSYRLNVESDDADFAVAIGKDPKADSDLLRTIGGAVALGGLVLGLTCVLIGLRRRRFAAEAVELAEIRNPTAPPPPPPPVPPMHPGYRPETPPIRPPEQSSIRLPDRPSAPGFAPPTAPPTARPADAAPEEPTDD